MEPQTLKITADILSEIEEFMFYYCAFQVM